MSSTLVTFSVIFLIILIVFILYLVIKNKLSIKYALPWLLSSLLLLLFAIIPGFLGFITDLLGFRTPSNMILILLICLLFVMTIVLSVIVSRQKDQIRLLIQEVSMLKGNKND